MIYDTSGTPVYSAAIALESNEEKTAEVDIDCLAGYSLSGTSVSGITVTAKHQDAVSWTNIETTPISLATWAGETERFLIKFSASTVSSPERLSFTLTVGPS